jgi:23S rRNA (adenine2503-C2)-methyltransferase
MNETPVLIYDLDLPAISEILSSWGEPAFRARQVWQGLYQQLWASASEFTNLPVELRQKLAQHFNFSALTPAMVLQSSDKETTKTLFTLSDKNAIEAVLMLYDERRTLCISSQAGCAMGCVFCATGQMGFRRHLTSGEIVEQVLHYARLLKSRGERVTNIVIMGMGEPFHNYANTIAAIDRLNHPDGMNLGERRFTISTVGIAPAIRKFASEKRQINLAISLHAPNDENRSALMPVNRKSPLGELLDACRDYIAQTNRRLTFEWALIQDENDSVETARELARLLKGMLCHVNVIPLNPTRKFAGHATTHQRAEAFRAELEKAGIPCTIRIRRGIDIHAGCGQLATDAETTK